MFHVNTEFLCMQCMGIGPHLSAMGKSHCFSQFVAGTLGIFSSYDGDGPSKLVFVQQRQDTCLVVRATLGFSLNIGREIGTPLEVRQETQGPFTVATGILGFLSILKRRLALSPFEALNSVFLSICQKDVRPPVKMKRGTRAFSRVSTGDSDSPSPCEMKDEPAFKSLQGNPALFQLRTSRCPFHLRHQTQGPLSYL